MIEAGAGYQLHGVKGAAVGEGAGFVDGDDGRMFQARDELGFAGQGRVEDLKGHAPVEIAVARGIDHAEAAAAQFGFEFIAGAGQVGEGADFAEVIEDGVGYVHMRRISSRSSRSPAVTPRRRSLTNWRSMRRAQAR